MPIRENAIGTSFQQLNGTPKYLGTVVTTKSNYDTTTPFCVVDGTATFASVVAGNTVLVTLLESGYVHTLTGVDGAPANETQFQGNAGTDTQDAAAFVAAWNAHSVLSGYAKATSSAAVVSFSFRPGAPLVSITQGSGATITFARCGKIGQSLGGRRLLVQAAGDTRIGFGRTSAAAIAEADATNGLLLAADSSRVISVREDYGYLASTGASLRVYDLQ